MPHPLANVDQVLPFRHHEISETLSPAVQRCVLSKVPPNSLYKRSLKVSCSKDGHHLFLFSEVEWNELPPVARWYRQKLSLVDP